VGEVRIARVVSPEWVDGTTQGLYEGYDAFIEKKSASVSCIPLFILFLCALTNSYGCFLAVRCEESHCR